MDRMMEWLVTGERPMPHGVIGFAKSASGGGKSKRRDSDDDDEDDDDDDEEEDDEDEDDDEDDDLADLSDDELRAELKKAKASLSKAGGSVKSKRAKIRKLNRELEEARRPKPASKKKGGSGDDDDEPDLDTIRSEARADGEKAGLTRAKKAEARAALLQAGVNPERVAKAVGLIDLDELDLDDDGLDGIDEAIDDLKADWPEMFATKRKRRGSVAGEGDRDGDAAKARKSKMTPSERQAALATGKR